MWQKAIAGVDIAEKSYKRVKNLFDQGVMPAQKLDEVTAQRNAAIATEKAAKAQYTMAKNGAEREDKMAAAALVDRAKGAVAEVESYLKETYLIAQAAGEVSEIFPKVGELVGTGAPIMNIAIMDDMWVTFNVREDLLKNLTMGSEFDAIVPALDNQTIRLKVHYMKDLGTYAAWKATKTTGQFDLKTFEVKATPLEREKKYIALWLVMKRECHRLVSRPLYLFCMVIAPLFCYIFFTTLMDSGLPTNMPVGAVDLDNSASSRNILRNLDAFGQTAVVARYSSVNEARTAMQEGKIYGFFYIPKGMSADAQSQRQPKLSFYTNNSYLIAGSLLFKDMKMMSELASGAAARSVLYAKGATEDQAMGYLQPIVIDTHPIQNPWLNYSVYLCNTLVPGVLMLLIFMVTVFSIGVEIKDRTAREWLRLSNNSIYIALAGKLLPQTVVFFIMGIFYNVYLYGYLHFPCNSGILPMLLATLCLVLASQCCGILMIGTLPTLRLGLSFASLWGVISFSISGFSFPVMAMNPVLQALSNLFPLRHYFLIYVDQALNGYSMAYSWSNYMALLIFMLLPFFVVHRLKEALIYYKYVP